MAVSSVPLCVNRYSRVDSGGCGLTFAHVDKLARFGVATKGFVFVLVGMLALLAALGGGGRVTGQEGAVRAVGDWPLGHALLLAISVGLAAYALWRGAQAVFGLGAKAGGVLHRVGCALIAFIYSGLALAAFQMARGAPEGRAGHGHARVWIARLVAEPLGASAVGVAGGAIMAFGLYEIWQGLTARFAGELDTSGASPEVQRWTIHAGRVGHAARGLVFQVMGYGLIRAALDARSAEMRDLGGALRQLAQQQFGAAILGFVAAGLVAYGLYTLSTARFQRVDRAAPA